jgi:hypothetical protein
MLCRVASDVNAGFAGNCTLQRDFLQNLSAAANSLQVALPGQVRTRPVSNADKKSKAHYCAIRLCGLAVQKQS